MEQIGFIRLRCAVVIDAQLLLLPVATVDVVKLQIATVQTQVARHAEGILRGQFRQKAAFPLQNGSFFVMDDYISSGQR